MKTLICVFCFLTSTCFSQFGNPDLEGKVIPARVIYRDETRVNQVRMRYEKPEEFCNPYAKFLIYDPQTVWIIKDSTTDAILVEAFAFENGEIYGKAVDPEYPMKYKMRHSSTPEFDEMNHLTHAHFQIQGAINTKTFIHKKVGIYDRYSYTRKLTEQPVKGELLDLDGQVRQWVSDSPEILRELAQADSMTASNRAKEKELRKADSLERAKAIADNNGKGLGLVERTKRDLALADRIYELGPKRTDLNPIVHNYNAWYEVKHPGKIKYTLTSPPLHEKTQLDLFLEQKRKPVTPGKQAAVSTTAPEVLDAAYVNRPTKASGEIASAKDNLPVKKESFDAKMERIKTDGNKVGVLFIHGSVKTKTKPASNSTGAGPSMSSGMGEDIYLDSEYKDTSLQSLGSDFTAELNTALRRNDIELVDLGNIPYRKSRVMGVETLQDDWWTTKYKVLFVYTIDPLLSVFQYTTAGNHKFEASLHFGSSVMVYEYIGGPESKEKETLAQMSGFGAFFTPKISEDQAILEVKPLYEKIVAALEYPLKEKIKTERSADITKLVEKKLR